MPIDDKPEQVQPQRPDGAIAGINFSLDDPDDPFSTEAFRKLVQKYDVANIADMKCGRHLQIPLSKTWGHVKVLVENLGSCDVIVTLIEGPTRNQPYFPGPATRIDKAEVTVAHKEVGKAPHNGSAAGEGVNFIDFDCTEEDGVQMDDQCKFEYKIRCY
jgi:hypothetical protein